jgi:DNA-binding transcriptional LysR family regulator
MSAAQLAKSGLGFTIVPERAVLALGGLDQFHCYRIDSQYSTWDVNAFYKKDSYLDKADRYFIDLMKDVFTKQP